jgi:hypothetical protein
MNIFFKLENLEDLIDNYPNLPNTLNSDPNDPIVKLDFIQDVQEYQKDHYLTNAFPVNPSVNSNTVRKAKTGIARIQGTKTKAEERIHISPKISVSISVQKLEKSNFSF